MNRMTAWQCVNGSLVAPVGQGTWFLGEKSAARKNELAALRTGIDRGMNLIDTAEMYGNGRSEELVGEAITSYDRESLFVVSKVYPHNAGEDRIFVACENTLRRLKTDYLDLYLLHWRGSVPLEETVACMERLVRMGRIRRWGVSNLELEDLEELWDIQEGRNCATDQVLYHLGARQAETAVLPWMQQRDMSLMAYCPLAQAGSLRRNMTRNQTLLELAAEKHCTVWQILLAFLLARPGVLPIPRTGNAAHAAENAAAMELVLTPDDLARLDQSFPAPRQREWLEVV